jgi:hypothetical protein
VDSIAIDTPIGEILSQELSKQMPQIVTGRFEVAFLVKVNGWVS